MDRDLCATIGAHGDDLIYGLRSGTGSKRRMPVCFTRWLSWSRQCKQAAWPSWNIRTIRKRSRCRLYGKLTSGKGLHDARDVQGDVSINVALAVLLVNQHVWETTLKVFKEAALGASASPLT